MSLPHPVDIHVGQRLKYLRKLHGISQQELGKKRCLHVMTAQTLVELYLPTKMQALPSIFGFLPTLPT